MNYNEQDANFIRQELNVGNENILIRNPIDSRAIEAVCKEQGRGHWINIKDYAPHCYWDTRGNEFHLVFF